MSVVFVTSNEPAEVLEPSNGSLDLPASSVAAELPSVLRRRLFAVLAVRTHEFNAALGQSCSQRIAICRQVVDQPARLRRKNSLFKQRFDQRHFVWTSASNLSAQRKATAVHEDHDLATLAALRLTYAHPPFFAEENVPSAMASSQWMRPRRLSLRKVAPKPLSKLQRLSKL